MRIVDKAEAIEWLSSRGIYHQGDMLGGSFPRKATHYLPGDSGRKTAIAQALSGRLSEFDESILWIDEWGISSSSENWPLFYGYRRSLGETRSLEEAPGHIFTPSDGDAAFALLSMVLYFRLGAVFASSSGEAIRISHDEWIDVYGLDLGDPENDIFAVAKWFIEEHTE
jgi:hypothetical protein